MIKIKEAKLIHNMLISRFGGIEGIRDEGALESALKRPYSTFDQTDLYPNPAEKAAAILESIITNHPFLDGNKRIGYVLMRLTLLQEGLDIEADQNEKYDFVMAISKGRYNFYQIKDWISKRIMKI